MHSNLKKNKWGMHSNQKGEELKLIWKKELDICQRTRNFENKGSHMRCILNDDGLSSLEENIYR